MIFGGFEKFTLIDYPGKTACMVYTIGCNFRCPYCHNPELVNETVAKTHTEKEILDFLDNRKNMLDGLVITGGEPTLHDDLLLFAAQVKARGFSLKLDTNGTHPEVIREAIRKKLIDYIAMDIKAPLSGYNRVVGRPVDIRAIRESIDIIMSSPIEYEFRTTIVKTLLSFKDIEKIGQSISGAKRYYLQKFVPNNILNAQFRDKVTYGDDELKNMQTMLNTYVQHCAIR